MTSEPVGVLDAATLIERFSKGELPREFVLNAARGMLPIEQEELVAVLAYLSLNADPEIGVVARQSLRDLPPRIIIGFSNNQNLDESTLTWLSSASDDPMVLEAVLRNRNTPDAVFATLAAKVPPTLQEVIVTNQERILRVPSILDQLFTNPLLSVDIRRRALEIREEFFDKRSRRAAEVKTQVLVEEELSEFVEDSEFMQELIEKAVSLEPAVEGQIEIPPDIESDESGKSVFFLISEMSPGQRVMRAFRGTKEERGILIRDRNRIVCVSVVRSPRITPTEIEAFAGMRNVDDEVLRLIGMSREWMSKYAILTTLVRNPKTPMGVAMPLVSRLTLRDLRELSRDKNVAEGVRTIARRLFVARTNK